MKRRTALRSALVPIAGLAPGCTILRSDGIPMHTLEDRLPRAAAARGLLIFLPGVYDYVQDFARHGFFDAVRERRLPLDMVAADANLRYFENRSIDTRIEQDLVLPARERNYRSIWLVGISLGALGAMLHAASHPPVTGVLAIAPFLGRPESVAEVQAAGGIDRWRPSPGSTMLEWESRLYGYLQRQVRAPEAQMSGLLLAYGRADRFAGEQSRLAALIGAGRTVVADGGHDWRTWRVLWQRALARWGERFVAGPA